MLDYPTALVCAFLLVVLQISVTPQLYPFGGGPDLIAILVVALALWRGIEVAAVAGFFGGLLLDAVLYRHLGMTSLAYLACAWMVATFSGRGEAGAGMLEPAPPRPLPWVLAGAVLVQVGLVAVQVLLGESYDVGYLVWHQIVPSLLQTTLLALILLPLLRRLFRPTRARPDVSAAPAI
jgi:rod shape-determining protein MreD